MAIIAPFKPIIYNRERIKDLSSVVTPPYDVISEEEQDEYYRRNPYNIIRLILGKKKKGDTDWDNCYTRASDYFNRWLSENVLIKVNKPLMLFTALDYKIKGAEKTRWGLICLVRIEEEDSGVILPHERTFSAHKDDRLKLMRACRAQFSQIFGLYEDHDNVVMNRIMEVEKNVPIWNFTFSDGTRHRIWEIDDPEVFRDVASFMKEKRIFIADGHHRYETARNYRNMMRVRHGMKPSNKSFEFVMMYLTNMYDEGLSILPSHRLIKECPNFDKEIFFKNINQWFDLMPLNVDCASGNASSQIEAILRKEGEQTSSFVFLLNGDSNLYLLKLRDGLRDEMGDDLHPSLKKLDVLVLSRFIFQKTLGFTKSDLDNEEIFHYQSDMGKAIQLTLKGHYHMAFLINPTKIEHVIEVASNRLIMPRKSTFFYPKILTGFALFRIDPNELITIP